MLRYLNSHRRPILVIGLTLALILFLALLPRQMMQVIVANLAANWTLIGLLLLFGLLMLSLIWTAGQRLDTGIFLYFNLHRLRKPWLDRLMWGLTQVGNGVFGFGSSAVFYLLRLQRQAIEMGLGIISLWLAVELFKAITARSRPFKVLEEANLVGRPERGRSFPSGHTAQAFFLMAFFANHLQPSIVGSLGLYALAALVGFTRVYIGVHYPRDVLGGAILGSVWGILTGVIVF